MNVPSPYGMRSTASQGGRGRIKMKIDPALLEFAKSMRHTATGAENLMWQVLCVKRVKPEIDSWV